MLARLSPDDVVTKHAGGVLLAVACYQRLGNASDSREVGVVARCAEDIHRHAVAVTDWLTTASTDSTLQPLLEATGLTSELVCKLFEIILQARLPKCDSCDLTPCVACSVLCCVLPVVLTFGLGQQRRQRSGSKRALPTP